MPLTISFRPQARRDLADLPQRVRATIVARLEKLAEDPSSVRLERLKGPWRHCSKLRLGDYRVILHVGQGRLRVITLGPRGSVYVKLARLDPHGETE
jgi:mRNA-degrading endonuclease RelE of RelBE toxin-antitoxin system